MSGLPPLADQILADALAGQHLARRAASLSSLGFQVMIDITADEISREQISELSALFELIGSDCAAAAAKGEAIEIASRHIPGEAA